MGSAPKLPPLPKPPPPPPDLTDQAVRDVAAGERRKAVSRGRKSTFLTGAGVALPAPGSGVPPLPGKL